MSDRNYKWLFAESSSAGGGRKTVAGSSWRIETAAQKPRRRRRRWRRHRRGLIDLTYFSRGTPARGRRWRRRPRTSDGDATNCVYLTAVLQRPRIKLHLLLFLLALLSALPPARSVSPSLFLFLFPFPLLSLIYSRSRVCSLSPSLSIFRCFSFALLVHPFLYIRQYVWPGRFFTLIATTESTATFFPVASWIDDDSPGSGDEEFANDRHEPMDVPRQFRLGSRGNDSIDQVQDFRIVHW